MALLTRRQCLAGLAAAGLAARAGTARAAPARIVCLEWTSAEMVVSLGATPIAVGDIRGYHDWVEGPALPQTTIDLGSRGEPNLELLGELRPDLIVGAYGYGLDESSFTGLAPTFNVPFYSGKAAPYAQAQEVTLQLGDLLGRGGEAHDLVERIEASIAQARATIEQKPRKPLCVVSMFDDRHVRVYGAGSLLQDVLDRLGLVNAWTGATSGWGFSTVGIEELVAVGDAQLISLDPIPQHVRIRIARSSLWANLPCVRNGEVRSIPPVWPFGGLAAAGRFATFVAGMS
ncbi:ABC transporter substrate-binding protein [Mesorhizobium sp. B2-3-4]|uniref:ABC transporter substrate-binding protein n=1 Tax=Mesorhizobium sp. B2-3-4 TaxID=2589959 RepID=UPI00112C87C9|nr:ABC transporter substrate-binding protein [Mesorhizobium sp. B2-3-4]TPM25371.1 ABC transporter substrate-binding protein [Mesorhizobium sp. B2-3-4]